MRARVGFHRCDGGSGEVSEVEDASNPACRAECLPDRKCSHPKCPPAWPPPDCLLEECPLEACPPAECPPPEWPPPPPCCATEGARRQTTHSKIGRTAATAHGRQFEWSWPYHPANVGSVYSCWGARECDFQCSAFSLRKRWVRVDRIPVERSTFRPSSMGLIHHRAILEWHWRKAVSSGPRRFRKVRRRRTRRGIA